VCVCGPLVDAVYCAGDNEAVILHQSAVMGIELKCHASTSMYFTHGGLYIDCNECIGFIP
jgi:hypothetical protein